MSKYIFQRMKDAIHENSEEIVLFKIKGLGMEVLLLKKDYDIALRDIKDRFLKLEEYEMVPRCNQLLDKFHVNQLIDGK